MESSIRSRGEWARVLCLGLLLTGGLARPAPAGAEAAEALARARFADGNVAYNVGEFRRALEAYAEAYQARPLPGFLFNMAQCHRQLGNDEKAAFFYRRFLGLVPEDEATRPLAKELLAEVERRVEEKARAAGQAAYAPGARVVAAAPPSASGKSGLLRKWWFWTGVGVVAAAGGAAYALASQGPVPATLGTVDAR